MFFVDMNLLPIMMICNYHLFQALDNVCLTGLDYKLDAICHPDTAGSRIFTKYLQQVGRGR